MQGLLLGVKLVTCVSLILFSVSCYNMVVRSEEAVDNTQSGGSGSPLVKTDKNPNTVTDKTSALTIVPDSDDDEDGKEEKKHVFDIIYTVMISHDLWWNVVLFILYVLPYL